MRPMNVDTMLNFEYSKPAEEIKAKASAKIVAIRAKVAEREQRIAKTRDEYKITDAMITQVLARARKNGGMVANYKMSGQYVEDDEEQRREINLGAGVINFLLTETDFMESERAQVEKLEMIVRNLENRRLYEGGCEWVVGIKLSTQELEYLGF